MDKRFNGKAIYQPKPAAAEYSKYICQFYYGCTCGCTYCCNRRWKWNAPKLKVHFKDECMALEVFGKELKANLPELQKHGLMFCISTDPMLPETINSTYDAVGICVRNKVPVKILTKRADFASALLQYVYRDLYEGDFEKYVAIGFTLTGHDELEPHASTNAERIEAMRKLHEAGFKTWASIEPIINFESSLQMIKETRGCCNLYKIGLLSGKKYDRDDLLDFIADVNAKAHLKPMFKVYFKDSLLAQAGVSRSELSGNCVDRDYNMFND